MTTSNKPRIALLFPGALGDFLCWLPALHALAPNARLEVFAKTEFADIVPLDIPVDTLERHEISRLFVPGGGMEQRVREFFSRYELVYSWLGSAQPVVSRELRAAAPGRVRLFAFRGADSALHQADYYLSCFGLPQGRSRGVDIPLRREALDWREQFCRSHGLQGKALLVIAPGSGAREKNWPADNFAVVARWWRKRRDSEVIVLLGPVEQERGGFESLAEEFIPARNLNLAQVTALLNRANFYLGNDSGITHLAAAAGAPTVALFGPSDARLWAPMGANVRHLSLAVACSPCEPRIMKSCPHRKCLTEFYPEKVIRELESLGGLATLTWGGAGIRVQPGSVAKQMKVNAE